ncbi:MAG: hypothetical protein JWO92_572 [Chitinophagaceae bacterium]|nr:hypothetical protein [Chitinophagaceae bacterium]
MKNIFYSFIFTLLLIPVFSFAYNDTIPLNRRVFHDNIIKEQQRADKIDGKVDGFIKISNVDEINLQVTDAIFRKVNNLRNDIEKNPALPTNNDKIRSLRLVESLVRNFNASWKSHKLPPALAPVLVDNFTSILKANARGESMAPYIDQVPYEVGMINSEIFKDNIGYKESRKYLFLKYSNLHPDKILSSIGPYIDEPFADELVLVAYHQSPSQIYSYAQAANSPQGKLIKRNPDNRIKTIVQLSTRKDALFYFPFLDDLISGKQTIESISKYVGTDSTKYDSVGYYKLLVRTEIDYYNRLLHKDTPVAMLGVNGLTDMLQRRAIQHFVTPINDLHEISNPAIRFKALNPLDAQDLYYMLVLGENEIFTSSYKNAFDYMIKRMGPVPHGDSLLMSVNFDHFKKFIKMAAGYNKLDTFLRTMRGTSEILMKAFVANLETAPLLEDGSPSLEDAVDVADSYGSIRNPALLRSMLKYVSDNEQRCAQNGSSRGQKIYNLLKMIFLSGDSTNHIDLSKEIGIPPVYTVDYTKLADDTGRIIEQVFFYGDKDGRESFASYMQSFQNPDWKIIPNKQWVEIKSTKGKPVLIFANLPLDNETDKDAAAQTALIDYLDTSNLRPTIVIHRGHSYHLQYTIKQLPESAKIIMLGSCGGYNNLAKILDYAPEAHIISTKQIGARDVNKPIIEAINNTLRAGKNIDWRDMWNNLEVLFTKAGRDKKDLFDDYIPPHKNLGALFIKAYSKTGSSL